MLAHRVSASIAWLATLFGTLKEHPLTFATLRGFLIGAGWGVYSSPKYPVASLGILPALLLFAGLLLVIIGSLAERFSRRLGLISPILTGFGGVSAGLCLGIYLMAVARQLSLMVAAVPLVIGIRLYALGTWAAVEAS